MTNSLRDALEEAVKEQAQRDEPEKKIEPEEPEEVIENDNDVESVEEDSPPESDHEESDESDDKEEKTQEHGIAPLDHWTENDKGVFNSLTREGKELIIRRHKEMEASFTKKNQTLSDEIKFSKSIKEALDPYQDYLKQNNLNPTHAIQSLMAVEKELRTAPLDKKQKLIRDLATSYGIHLNAPSEYEGEPERSDPQQQAILDEVFRLKEELRGIQSYQDQSRLSYYEGVVNEFSNSKDSNGQLKYPHFEKLEGIMTSLMKEKLALTLDEAYEKAIYVNDDLRKNYNMRQYNEQRRLEDKKTKLEASKRAGFNIKSKGGTISDDKKPMGLRDTLSQSWDDAVSSYS